MFSRNTAQCSRMERRGGLVTIPVAIQGGSLWISRDRMQFLLSWWYIDRFVYNEQASSTSIREACKQIRNPGPSIESLRTITQSVSWVFSIITYNQEMLSSRNERQTACRGSLKSLRASLLGLNWSQWLCSPTHIFCRIQDPNQNFTQSPYLKYLRVVNSIFSLPNTKSEKLEGRYLLRAFKDF